jgi:hypothetical protein
VKNGSYQKIVGGVTMMKMKLWTVLLLILCAAGAAQAVDVINVDLNGYNDSKPYVGNGPYDVGNDTVWTVYYGGWGEPVGSSRSEGLANYTQSHYCSVYSAQVWIGDNGQNHSFQYGSSLMDDGFVANAGTEPNLALFGEGAYQGVYDIYVLGSAAGSFKLGYYGNVTQKDINGFAPAGTFVEGGNYVVFQNVDINDASSGNIYIAYTNKINGLQLVKKKVPVEVANGTRIKAGNWDVAGERNTQDSESSAFGPDVFPDAQDTNDPNRIVGYIEPQEWMGYDINLSPAAAGDYNVAIEVNTAGQYGLSALNIFLDDKFINNVKYNKLTPASGDTNAVTVNLTKGIHTVKWRLPQEVMTWGTNIVAIKFTRLGNVVMNNCADVALYGLLYPGDFTGNCIEDIYDLDQMATNWLNKQ